MRIKYDPEIDAMYIYLEDRNKEVTPIRINEDVAIDIGEKERVVGIEILNASKYFKIKSKKPEIKVENLLVSSKK
ncbi:MAG TPA: DUF2283 domain-containing protein [bacterium]|nr:DUF2283 domain-containing protein [bacterium]